mmetsp:Transcript_57315/g.185666  ORF Transcript_57315/g.185666 Transcript_57315/m.185666 type:complete len:679 (+) Transcript_57315:37-2073(+)
MVRRDGHSPVPLSHVPVSMELTDAVVIVGGAAGAAEGAGKGAGKAGKGPPPAKGKGKGSDGKGIGSKGAGKSQPPSHLAAPADAARLRIHTSRADQNISGTLWEGLNPWAEGAQQRFPAWRLNIDRLRGLWEPPPQEPERAERSGALVARRREAGILDGKALMKMEVIVRGFHLSPDMVRSLLDGAFDVCTAEVKEVLAYQVAPVAEESAAALRGYVERNGDASLSRSEQVLWAIASTRYGSARLRLIEVHSSLDSQIHAFKQKVNAPQRLIDRLRGSDSLKMLLQVILVVRNVTSQEEWNSFPMNGLGETLQRERARRIPHGASADRLTEWHRENFPSTLRLVAEMVTDLERSHSELRFIRMAALSKAARLDGPRKLIWEFLGDMTPSIFDVFDLLKECDTRIFDEENMSSMTMTHVTWRIMSGGSGDLDFVRNHMESRLFEGGSGERSIAQSWLRHIDEIVPKLNHGVGCLEEHMQSYVQLLCSVSSLVGCSASQYESNDELCSKAKEAMYHLQKLGHSMQREIDHLHFVRKARTRESQMRQALEGGHGAVHLPARTWDPVKTWQEVLYTTSDADIIRQLRAEAVEAAAAAAALRLGGAAQAYAVASSDAPEVAQAKAEAKAKAKSKPQRERYADMIHSGIEGMYRRDPVTGTWGPRLDGVDGTSDSPFADGQAII